MEYQLLIYLNRRTNLTTQPTHPPLDVKDKTQKETAKKKIFIENIYAEKRGIMSPLFFFLAADSLEWNQIKFNLIFFVKNNGYSGITVPLR